MTVTGTEAVGMLGLSACIAAADQMIKRSVAGFKVGGIIAGFPPFIELIRTENSGAAFSLFSGRGVILVGLTALMLMALLLSMLLYRGMSRKARWAMAALLGGGIGNWIDRFIRGTVTDYIRLLFIDFPVFNLADVFISLSVIYLIILLLTGRFETSTGENHGTDH